MASMTMSSVAARAVSARATFRGSSKVSAVAPKAVAKRNVVVRAEGEVSVCVFFLYIFSRANRRKNFAGRHGSRRTPGRQGERDGMRLLARR